MIYSLAKGAGGFWGDFRKKAKCNPKKFFSVKIGYSSGLGYYFRDFTKC